MEPEVTVNWTVVETDIHPCYEIDPFLHTVKNTSSMMCVLLCTFLALLSIITICGNLLVIISIIYFKQLHTPTNYLILSLAVTDLLVGIIVFPLRMMFSVSSCLYYTDLFCSVGTTVDISLTVCSILNLSCISIDRYYAVCQPLIYRTKMSNHVVMIMILVSWGISALTAISEMIAELNNEKCTEMCFTVVLVENTIVIVENIVTVFSSFYLPVIMMICIFCIYLKIFIVAQRQVRSIQNTTCQSTKARATVSKMERKATKTLTIVLGICLLCWTPYFLSYTIVAFRNVSLPLPVIETLNWLTLLNSMLNPFIYAFFYSWFRAAFRMIISGKIFHGDFMNTQLQ